jgi:hypothetical protein
MFDNFRSRIEKFNQKFEPTSTPEKEKIKFSLEINYGHKSLTQFFPNSDYENVTVGSIAKIKEQFIQKFIHMYSDEHPGTKISAQDLEVKITPTGDSKDLVDLV